MGWTGYYTMKSFDEVFLEEFNRGGFSVVEYNKVSQYQQTAFYAAVKHPDGFIFGLVVLFAKHKDGDVMWKDMSETMHPYYYDMAKSVFELLDPLKEMGFDEIPEMAIEWRKEVGRRVGLGIDKEGTILQEYKLNI